MKKLIVLFIICIFIVSCSSTPEEKLIKTIDNLVEKEFVPKLKDPLSYEKVSAMIFDTATVAKWIIKYPEDSTKMKNEYPNGIMCIKVSYTYRAKNSFGALVLEEKTFRYYPKTKGLGM